MKKVKTKIKVDLAIGFIMVVAVVAISAIATSLLGPISKGSLNFSAKPIQTNYGWCVTGIFNIGKRMTRDDCLRRLTDDDPNTKFYAFCRDVAGQPERDAGNCKCNYKFDNGTPNDPDDDIPAPFEPSSRLIELILLRDELIERVNDGHRTTEDLTLFYEFSVASGLRCACGVYSAGEAPSDVNLPNNSITLLGNEYRGNFELAKKANKLFSNMAKLENDCRPLPVGCRIKNVYGTWSGNHSSGKAIDFCCSENKSFCDKTKINDLMNRIKQADSNNYFSIIRECTTQERACNSTTGCTGGLVHIDLTHPVPFIQTNCNSVLR